MYADPLDATDAGEVGMYSTDSGDVSWNVPLGRFRAATWPVGTSPHSWQAVAAPGASASRARSSPRRSSAAPSYDLLDDEELLAAAHDEFATRTDGLEYESPLEPDTTPSNLSR